MILHDLNVVRAVLAPLEAHPPLPVDPNAELTLTVTPEGFKMVAGQGPQGFKRIGGIQQAEPFLGLSREALELPNSLAIEKPLRAAILETSNHGGI